MIQRLVWMLTRISVFIMQMDTCTIRNIDFRVVRVVSTKVPVENETAGLRKMKYTLPPSRK